MSSLEALGLAGGGWGGSVALSLPCWTSLTSLLASGPAYFFFFFKRAGQIAIETSLGEEFLVLRSCTLTFPANSAPFLIVPGKGSVLGVQEKRTV